MKRHLHLVKPGVAHEIQHVVEHFRRVAVEAEDETAVDGDAVGLNFGNGFLVKILLAQTSSCFSVQRRKGLRGADFRGR